MAFFLNSWEGAGLYMGLVVEERQGHYIYRAKNYKYASPKYLIEAVFIMTF